ncbi:MAG: hypothetical protein ACRDD2_01075 [Sarcina sp.]
MLNNLILYTKNGEIKYFINQCDRELLGNVYNKDLFFEVVSWDIFNYLSQLSLKNELILKKGATEITKGTVEVIPLKIPPKTPTKEEILADGIMDNTLLANELSKQTHGLSMNLAENNSLCENLKQQVSVLSTALFEMTMKK